MANHLRTTRPGEPQFRRMWFCMKLLGLVVVFAFFTAVVIGLPFPGLWNALFVPFFATSPFVILAFIALFFFRGTWFKAKAKHHETMLKLRDDPDFQ